MRAVRKLPKQPNRVMTCARFRQRLIELSGDFVTHNHRLDNDSQRLTFDEWLQRLESYNRPRAGALSA